MAPVLPAASMRRAASCAQKNTASRLVERTRRHSSSGISTARPACATPALLTRIVTVPNAFSAASNAFAIAARSRTSASIGTALPPIFSIFAVSVFEAIGAPRHQRHRGAVLGQAFGEAHAEPARRTGHHGDFAVKIEDLCRRHDSARSRYRVMGISTYSKTVIVHTRRATAAISCRGAVRFQTNRLASFISPSTQPCVATSRTATR